MDGANITSCKKCSEAMTGCVNCTANNKCTQCIESGWRKNGDTCEECTGVDKCMKCDTKAAECQKCIAGRNLIKIGETQICELCQATCIDCASRNTCNKCQTGYYLNSSRVCIKAPTNCNAYNMSGGSCDLCAHGYRQVTRESGMMVCVPCNNSSVGYFNCFNACSESGK